MAVENSPREGHLDFLDGLRGGAILAVCLFHALWPSFGSDAPVWDDWHRVSPLPLRDLLLLPAYLGWAGVAVFFVISGFCIHLTRQRSGAGWRVFFLRRFFRIYPPYLIAVLLFALMLPATRLDFHSRHNLDQLLSHLLLVHNVLGPGFLYGIDPALWSIGVETQLYLLYPGLLFLVKKTGWNRSLLLLGSVEVAFRLGFACFTPNDPQRWWLLGNPLMYGFSWTLGAWLCDRWRQGKKLPPVVTRVGLWSALGIASYFFSFTYGFGFLFWALATTGAVSRILTGEFNPRMATSPFLRHIGLISYSVYLLHQPLLNLVAIFLPRGWVAFGGCLVLLPAIFLLSWLFYRAIERPSMAMGRWLERRLRRHRVVPHFNQSIPDPASITP